MRIFETAFQAGKSFPRSAIAIGKFDALHVGHKRVIGAAVSKAREAGARCLVVTFDPASAEFLRLYPYTPVLPLAKRIEILGSWGVDGVVLLPFTKELACLSPEAFAKDVLMMQLKPSAVFVGADFCFGKDRAGSVGTLEGLGPSLGFTVHSVPLAVVGGEKVSASTIRRLIDAGRRAEAEKLLGWELDGPTRRARTSR